MWDVTDTNLIKSIKKIAQKKRYSYEDIATLNKIIGKKPCMSYAREAREARAKQLVMFISCFKTIPGRSFLDVGSGYGSEVLEAEERGAALSVGIDLCIHPVIFKEAKERGLACNMIKASIASAPFQNGTFDIIHTNSFEHFTKPYKSLSEIIRVTKKGGVIILLIGGFYYTADASHFYKHVNIPWSHLLFDHELLYRLVRENSFEFYGESPQEFASRVIQQFKELNKLDVDDYKSMIFKAPDTEIRYYKEYKKESLLQKSFYEIFKDKLKKYSKRSLCTTHITAVLKKI